tara:strand:+ start:838 stop:1689 length:852 start_codon:yes stop_codon:yes gene_type:complete
MYNLVGIGKAGCNIVDKLGPYGNYSCFFIDKDLKTKKANLSVPNFDNPEEYEVFSPQKLNNFAKKINGDITLVLSGDSIISGITLVFLQKIKTLGHSISVVYVTPDLELVNGDKMLQERVVRNVLQQYARSAAIDKIMMLSNPALEEATGGTTIMSYYNDINDIFVNAYNMINVFKNSKSISDTFSKTSNISRIYTIGMFDIDGGYENLFFPLKEPAEVVYYFGINEEKLNTEKNLFRKITDFITHKKEQYEKVSFGIYSTNYEHDVGYMEVFSSKIQEVVEN